MSDCTCIKATFAEAPEITQISATLTNLHYTWDEYTVRDPWCPVHKEYLFEYESKPE